MKKIVLTIVTIAGLLLSCSDDDSASAGNGDTNNITQLIGRWKLAGISGQTLGACAEASYITFDANGSFEQRLSGSNSFVFLDPDGNDIPVSTCISATDTGDYTVNTATNELSISYPEFSDMAIFTLAKDQLTLSYDDGEYVESYNRESPENMIAEIDPLVGRWNFFASSDQGGPFVEVEMGDCYENVYIIFGIEGNFVAEFPIDENDQCTFNRSFGTYTNDSSEITVVSDTNGTGNSRTSFTIEGDFLTLDQSGDGTYFERFKRSED